MPSDRTAADTTSQFAEDLRLLRVRAGSPTLAHLQHATGVSRTVLSDAFAGKQLPSARTVDGIVRACGGEPDEWLRRRDRIAALSASAASASAAEVVEATPPVVEAPEASAGTVGSTSAAPARRGGRALRRSTAALIAAAAFVIGSAGSGLVVAGVLGGRIDTLTQALAEAAPVAPHAQIVVENGADPARTPCVDDAEVVASADRANDTRIEIVWSDKCYAGWGRIARYDGKAEGNLVKIGIFPETAPNGPDRQDATEPGVEGAYTTLVVRPTAQTRLCAVGAITVDGETIDLGAPICA